MTREVWPALLARLEQRVEAGMKKYGVPLATDNGRDPLLDAWEEAADLLFYLTQCLMERHPSAERKDNDARPEEARHQSRYTQEV